MLFPSDITPQCISMVISTYIEIDRDIQRVEQMFWFSHTLPLSWPCAVILSFLHEMTACCDITVAVIYAIRSEDIFGWKSCPWRNDHKYEVLSVKDNGFRMLIDCQSNHLELWNRVDYFVQRLHRCAGNYTLTAWVKNTLGYFETHCVVIAFLGLNLLSLKVCDQSSQVVSKFSSQLTDIS